MMPSGGGTEEPKSGMDHEMLVVCSLSEILVGCKAVCCLAVIIWSVPWKKL